jgi:hypothetical protein
MRYCSKKSILAKKININVLPLSCPSISEYMLLIPNTLRKYQDAELTLQTNTNTVDTLTGLLIDLIDNFDITNII